LEGAAHARVTKKGIRRPLGLFYGRGRRGPPLGPVFAGATGATDANWAPHLARLADFWSAARSGATLAAIKRARRAWPAGAVRALALVWAGMVLGVSFLATPAKFLAPSLALPVALDVGRHTFGVFGAVELALAAALALLGPLAAGEGRRLLPLAPGLVVLAQALWLRPLLDARVQQIIGGAMPPPSHVHLGYVACEAAKVALLLFMGLVAARPALRGR
jgi:hypothetical protein